MYLVKDKSSSKIIHTNPAPLSQKLKDEEIFHGFDSKTMEVVRKEDTMKTGTEGETLSFKAKKGLIKISNTQKIVVVDSEEKIVEKPFQDLVAEGLIRLNEPFEFLDDDELKQRTIEQTLEEDLLSTIDQCIVALKRVNARIDLKISESYPPGHEMKLTKNYLAWLKDDQPENDEREKAFNEMQETIERIKSDHKELKLKIKERQAEIEMKIKTGRK